MKTLLLDDLLEQNTTAEAPSVLAEHETSGLSFYDIPAPLHLTFDEPHHGTSNPLQAWAQENIPSKIPSDAIPDAHPATDTPVEEHDSSPSSSEEEDYDSSTDYQPPKQQRAPRFSTLSLYKRNARKTENSEKPKRSTLFSQEEIKCLVKHYEEHHSVNSKKRPKLAKLKIIQDELKTIEGKNYSITQITNWLDHYRYRFSQKYVKKMSM